MSDGKINDGGIAVKALYRRRDATAKTGDRFLSAERASPGGLDGSPLREARFGEGFGRGIRLGEMPDLGQRI
jgi:hypothetical protein